MNNLTLKLEHFLMSLPQKEVKSKPSLGREVHSLMKKLRMLKSLNNKKVVRS